MPGQTWKFPKTAGTADFISALDHLGVLIYSICKPYWCRNKQAKGGITWCFSNRQEWRENFHSNQPDMRVPGLWEETGEASFPFRTNNISNCIFSIDHSGKKRNTVLTAAGQQVLWPGAKVNILPGKYEKLLSSKTASTSGIPHGCWPQISLSLLISGGPLRWKMFVSWTWVIIKGKNENKSCVAVESADGFHVRGDNLKITLRGDAKTWRTTWDMRGNKGRNVKLRFPHSSAVFAGDGSKKWVRSVPNENQFQQIRRSFIDSKISINCFWCEWDPHLISCASSSSSSSSTSSSLPLLLLLLLFGKQQTSWPWFVTHSIENSSCCHGIRRGLSVSVTEMKSSTFSLFHATAFLLLR